MQDKPRILVVDDDIDICANLCDILLDLGYHVQIAHDGPSALDLVRRHRFDVVLLDFKMPGMDGLTLHREIKLIRTEIVALLVTAYTSEGTAKAAQADGIWQVVNKPVALSRLLTLIKDAVESPLVLVVDDDRDLCANLLDVLRLEGYRVGIAHDDRQVLERLENTNYQVVLIDLKLPEGDGGEVFRKVQEANPRARTILITEAGPEDAVLAEQILSDGANAICYKPFDVPRLLETLDRLTGTNPVPEIT